MRNVATKEAMSYIKSVMRGWKGRKAYINVSDKPRRLTSMWDGGSKDEYHGIELATGKRVSLPLCGFMSVQPDYIPQAGVVVIEHSIFCGKDSGCTLYVHPADAARFGVALPEPEKPAE